MNATPPRRPEWLAAAQRRHAELVETYRALHRRPEVGLLLPETQALVLDRLARLGLAPRTGGRSSAVVTRIVGGRAAPVLLRADMDALPQREETGLDFAAANGAMHACGHDAHQAMLLTAAALLVERADELPGDVWLFFQAGEEGHDGCRVALDDGLLDDALAAAPRAAYALHQLPTLPAGVVATRPGPLLASSDGVTITVTGRGGHVALPHLTLDPVPVACELVLALQALVTRRVDVFDPAVLTVSRFSTGEGGGGLIPERVELEATVRAFADDTRRLVLDGVRRTAAGVAAAHGVDASVEFTGGYPVTVNDPVAARAALAVAADVVGPAAAVELDRPLPASEDFAHLLRRVPGTMLLLGTAPGADPAPLHSPRMRIDEDALPVGAAVLAALAAAPDQPKEDSRC